MSTTVSGAPKPCAKSLILIQLLVAHQSVLVLLHTLKVPLTVPHAKAVWMALASFETEWTHGRQRGLVISHPIFFFLPITVFFPMTPLPSLIPPAFLQSASDPSLNDVCEHGYSCIPPRFRLFCSDLGVMQYWSWEQTSFDYEYGMPELPPSSLLPLIPFLFLVPSFFSFFFSKYSNTL